MPKKNTMDSNTLTTATALESNFLMMSTMSCKLDRYAGRTVSFFARDNSAIEFASWSLKLKETLR